MTQRPLIAIVGPCGSGKSTLAAALRRQGYRARALAQEHSYVPQMWRRMARPALLVYLDVSAAEVNRRLGRTDWTEAIVRRQRERLAHARRHADFYLHTDGLALEEILERVVAFLQERGIAPGPGEENRVPSG